MKAHVTVHGGKLCASITLNSADPPAARSLGEALRLLGFRHAAIAQATLSEADQAAADGVVVGERDGVRVRALHATEGHSDRRGDSEDCLAKLHFVWTSR